MFVAQRCRVKLNDKITFDEQLDLSSVANSMLDDSKTAASTESTWLMPYVITVTACALRMRLNGPCEAVTGAVCVAYFPKCYCDSCATIRVVYHRLIGHLCCWSEQCVQAITMSCVQS
mgnify:CR=1 FL=1